MDLRTYKHKSDSLKREKAEQIALVMEIANFNAMPLNLEQAKEEVQVVNTD